MDSITQSAPHHRMHDACWPSPTCGRQEGAHGCEAAVRGATAAVRAQAHVASLAAGGGSVGYLGGGVTDVKPLSNLEVSRATPNNESTM